MTCKILYMSCPTNASSYGLVWVGELVRSALGRLVYNLPHSL